MNDYVTKPINLTELFFIISKWHKNEEKLIDEKLLRHFDYEDGLKRVNGNRKLYEEILIKFAHNTSDLLERLNINLKDGNRELLGRELHTLKGVSANLGSKKIEKLCISLEKSNKDLQDIKILDEFEILKRVLKESIEDIGNLVKIPYIVEANELTKEEILKKLKEIQFYAENYDIKANEILQELIEPMKKIGFGVEILTLERILNEYDYEKALELCQKINESI